MSRINFIHLTQNHNGEEDFPYDSLDLAHYLKYLIEKPNKSEKA